HEPYNQPISADLAVLTACETGLGAYSDGEGVLSLAYAFQYAGCPNVMYSLWKIDDKQSTEIARGFYNELKSGKTYSGALRAAKLNYMNRVPQELAAPFYWSGMVIAGTNGQFEVDNSWPIWLYVLVISVIIILTVIVMRRIRLKV
ncbi:MAG TPA: CHAT domain-containing protein, partial [Cryomorphaceae bacterium]|nr:CHAT domain-containing protein [Cryomorphaceae bacterium]